MKTYQRILSLLLCFVVSCSSFSAVHIAKAMTTNPLDDILQSAMSSWMGSNAKGFIEVKGRDYTVEWPWGGGFSSTVPRDYYTVCMNSVEDKSGNVTNYYRGGDTTNTKIIDSYNKTFNTIHNTTNNTNNYRANVKLSDFLNNYTTNNITNTTNNRYTYSADFKSWYYDNTTNNYTYNEFNKNDYTQNNLYYNQDNSRYYISIDNSTDEYYLVDVQYSPTFVTVNYTYNTTNVNNTEKVGDVTNVYYYELKDGRNSSTLTAAEVAGLDVGYDAANYELVTDDPNTLSLQHFDGDYTDSSSYNRTFYSQNRSSNYVDSGAFGKAVALPNGSAAGVTIPGLSGYNDLTFDFRVYFNDIKGLGVYFGDTCILQKMPDYRSWSGTEKYSDHGRTSRAATGWSSSATSGYSVGGHYTVMGSYSTTLSSTPGVPSSWDSSGYTESFSADSKVGILTGFTAPAVHSRQHTRYDECYFKGSIDYINDNRTLYYADFERTNTATVEYRSTPTYSVLADFAHESYKNQWTSMRITISGSYIYYFVNGDLVGAGSFTKPTADKFYIKSSGTVYLDELRVTTGSLSSTGVYTPPSAPYDTNKVLALPDILVENTVYVQNSTPVTICRVGGVRPSNPSKGFLYIPLHSDYTGGQPQLYDGNNWIDVTAMVYDGSTTVNALGFQFSPVGSSPDVDTDARPERPTKPGEDVDPDTCTHDWKETDRTAATCSTPGSVDYTCSKCQKTKKETLAKLAHTWEVKQTVQTTYDENGNIQVQGFILYRCSVCGEEYKDVNGSGPPGSSSSGDEEEGFLGWLLRKIGELLGAVGGGIIGLLQAALGKIFDGLIELVTMAFDKLSRLVNLFGAFGDALGVLWTWLPEEIMLVLAAGVTVFVFVALLKLFMK